MSRFALACALVATTACTSTRLIPRSELDAVFAAPIHDGAVVRTTEIWKSRIDPISDVRFRRYDGQWTDWMQARSLSVAPGWVGSSWRGYHTADIQDAEVRDLSGTKTFMAVVGTTSLAIAVAPILLLASMVPSGGGGGSWGGHGGGHASSGAGRLLSDGHLDSAPDPSGTWQPEMQAPPASATALFTSGSTRRALITVAATAEVGTNTHASTILDGGFGALRIGEVFEIGMGGMHLAAKTATGWWNGGLALFRIGLHLPIDAAHRVAIPLTIDVGGGGGEALGVAARLRTGLSVRVSRRAAVTLIPLAPTYLNWKHGVPGGGSKTSYTTSLELGLAF